MTSFDARCLIDALPAFADSIPATKAVRAFCCSYGIDFDPQQCQQQLGAVSVAGFNIAVHRFQPQNPCGTAVLVHGYHDHHALYGHLIRYLLERRLSVVCFDLPGHGLSSGDRGSISDFRLYQQVLKAIITSQAVPQDSPLHLLGQSTGAAIINQYLLETRPQPDGQIVLLAPLVRPARWPFVATAHSLLKPLVRSVPRQFTSNSNDAEFLQFVSEEDRLQERTITVEWVGAMKRWIRQFMQLPANPDYAPLIIQGEQDQTVDWRFNMRVMAEKFPAAETLLLADARHHLANESAPIRRQYMDWLDLHWPPQS